MRTYLELSPASGRSKKHIVEVKNLTHIGISGYQERSKHRITVSSQGLVAAWFDDAAYLSGPSHVESNLEIPFPQASALGRTKRSLNMTKGENAVFAQIGEAHPFVLHGRKYSRLEVVVK
ncbi:hypothetical protein KBC80_00460 [Candidatus Woesebacteria bacterium]|jgi:hypothetical protein|nr:hypothetical protein [Candidatus Woesebacteria bacterium]